VRSQNEEHSQLWLLLEPMERGGPLFTRSWALSVGPCPPWVAVPFISIVLAVMVILIGNASLQLSRSQCGFILLLARRIHPAPCVLTTWGGTNQKRNSRKKALSSSSSRLYPSHPLSVHSLRPPGLQENVPSWGRVHDRR